MGIPGPPQARPPCPCLIGSQRPGVGHQNSTRPIDSSPETQSRERQRRKGATSRHAQWRRDSRSFNSYLARKCVLPSKNRQKRRKERKQNHHPSSQRKEEEHEEEEWKKRNLDMTKHRFTSSVLVSPAYKQKCGRGVQRIQHGKWGRVGLPTKPFPFLICRAAGGLFEDGRREGHWA